MFLRNHRTVSTGVLVIAIVGLLLTGLAVASGPAIAADKEPPEPPHGIHGEVVDDDGDSLEGALVEIVDEDGDRVLNDTTDENGAYSTNVDGFDDGDAFTVTVADVDGESIDDADETTLTWTSGASDRVDLAVELETGSSGGGGGSGFSPGGDDRAPPADAAISVEPEVAVGEEVTFSAANSSAGDGEIVDYEWTIDGESYDTETVTVTAQETGELEAELTITTDRFQTDTATEAVTVVQPETMAIVTSDSASAAVGEEVTFSADDSSASDGEIVDYEWTIDGEPYDSHTVTVVAEDAGELEAELTITTGDGETDTASRTVTVEPAPVTPAISFAPDPAIVGEDVTFSAADSTANEGEIVDYEWATNGNTLFDTDEEITEVFHTTGTVDVELTVTTDDGANATATETLTVEEEPSGTGPVTILVTVLSFVLFVAGWWRVIAT